MAVEMVWRGYAFSLAETNCGQLQGAGSSRLRASRDAGATRSARDVLCACDTVERTGGWWRPEKREQGSRTP
jgi:hypothetical protein